MDNGNKAYIAIKPDGFVDGICEVQAEDSAQWCDRMQAAGLIVQARSADQAKALVFTHLTPAQVMAG